MHRTPIQREQMNLVKLIREIENSVAVVKEQINVLTVETLHLKYLDMQRNRGEAGISEPGNSLIKEEPQEMKLNLAVKKESRECEEMEEDEED